jgi:type I restriction enzyme S subunit
MSHYKPYPAYKDSGIEWIGRVPDHWVVGRLRDFVASISTGPFGTALSSKDYVSGGTPVINPSHISPDGCAAEENVTVDAPTAGRLAFWALRPGDIITARRGELGRAAVVRDEQDGWICGTGSLRITPATCKVMSEYIHSTLYADHARSWLDLQAVGSTMPNLSEGLIGDLPVAAPPTLDEQRSLLRAVKAEQQRIDALIAKKTRFIELLKEKRQALITYAVTKGLDANVTMKDSGVAWIGAVPEHWEIVPSTWLFVESNERAHADDEHLSATQKYGVIPLAEYERLEGRQVTHAVKNLEQRKHVEIDNFVISMRSFEGGIERVRARGCVRSSYVVLLAEPGADVGFFTYLLKSSTYIQGLQATSSFIRDGQDLSYANFRQVKMPAPTIAEQKAIAAHLDQSVGRIDALTSKTEQSIGLLKERRSALITAAVTGQIDLREDAA